MHSLKKHSVLALGYFLLIALLGLLLRLFPVVELPINYRFLVHTHSHIALLGWTYTALTTLIYKAYLSKASIERRYRMLFWCTQGTIIGMLLTFPFTGYALLSIVFSTLFLIASYIFMWFFVKHTIAAQKKTHAYKCIYASLWYMVLSSLGPWALGAIMNTAGSGSDLYRNAIYFYLHFQYNGWFVMALLGLLLYFLEQRKIELPHIGFKQFFWFMNLGVMATFCISLLWMKPSNSVYIISLLGSVMQLFAFFILIKHVLPFKSKVNRMDSKLFYLSLKIAAIFFLVKVFLQLLGSVPYFASIVSSNIDLVIGYLHWIFLGVVSLTVLAFLFHSKLIELSRTSIILYLLGFMLTEGLIFYKGAMAWIKEPVMQYYPWLLLFASCLLVIAIGSIVILQLRQTLVQKLRLK
ncbi:hypothetical protein [Flagellimonas algicola]|uniref:Uncharacterized protein n=1 Tax=Flagellimonas algicola TaxID=2583815 RepID=A0ABY2WN14_9FLAO|nr:hypothetical protein [Allomuricauda algicola]TMU56137.1 hypothetical protein FGG15_00950 [Allomuricauda algicola]